MNESKAPQDDVVNGVPHRLLDGYDGGDAPPPEFLNQLLQGAPAEIRARAEEFARQRQQAQEGAQ